METPANRPLVDGMRGSVDASGNLIQAVKLTPERGIYARSNVIALCF